MVGRVVRISVSEGGVPKDPVERAKVTRMGLEGDRQDDTRFHGGPSRAVSLFSLEVIERLRAEGHPIAPGTAGENVTVEGLDWPSVAPGSRLLFQGGVALRVAKYCTPCEKVRGSFFDGDVSRIAQKRHPGESRVTASVLLEGELRTGEGVTLETELEGERRVGLCVTCRQARRLLSARGSLFTLCERAATDASFAKYPRLPMRACPGYDPREE